MSAGCLLMSEGDDAEDTELTQELVNRLRAGDTAALDELLGLYGREVKAVAYTIVRNEADADEIAEDTFVSAWLKIATLRDPAALRLWLLKITTRLALRHRARQHEGPLGARDVPALGSDHTTAIVDRVTLDAALRSLPPGMRAVVALHYVADLTVDEVAQTLRRSRNTVKSQLRSSLKHMRESLAEKSAATREVVR